MRILYLNHNIAGRGTYFRCLHFARQIARVGHSVDLVTCAAAPCADWRLETIDGVRVHHTPRLRPPARHDGGYAPFDILERLRFVAAAPFDLVHAFDHRPNVLVPAWWARRHFGPILVVDWADWWTRGGITTARRAPWIDTLEARIEEGQKRAADAVTVTSTVLYQRALDIGVARQRLVLLPSGADCEAIAPRDRDACRAELGLESEAAIVMLAAFSLWDLDRLLDAMAVVVQQWPAARLLFVGHEKDGDVYTAIDKRGLRDRVIVAGAVPYARLPVYLGAADVCALPLSDTLANRARGPIKFGDYIAAGRAVVIDNVGDCARLVARHRLGLVAGPSSGDLADAILALLRDPQLRRRMGANARAYAAGEGSWQARSAPLLELYAQLRPPA